MGSPIGSLQSVDSCLKDKRELLHFMSDRLEHLQCNDAITSLHHSFEIPKMMHIHHSAPCFSSSHLPSYDLLVNSIVGHITSIDFVQCLLLVSGHPPSEPWGNWNQKCSSFFSLCLLQLMNHPLPFVVSSHFCLVKFSSQRLVLPSHSWAMPFSAEVMGHPQYYCEGRVFLTQC